MRRSPLGRTAIRGDWVEKNVLAAVPHRQYVFTVPRMLRPIFSRKRGLLGELCHIVYFRAEPGARLICQYARNVGQWVSSYPFLADVRRESSSVARGSSGPSV